MAEVKTSRQIRDAAYREKNAVRIAAQKARHRIDNPETYRTRDLRRDVQKRRETLSRSNAKARTLRRALHLLRTARRRAVQKKLPYSLDKYIEHYQSIIDAGVCEETGLPFDMASNRGPFTPSLDRIKPALGYVYGNVRVVLWGLNAGFANFGQETYAEIATAYLRKKSLIPQ